MREVMNILQVHNYYQIPGGEDTVVANERQLLEEHGHYVITYYRNNSELKNMSKLKKMLLPLITIFNLKTYRDVKKLIRENHIDVVHVHNTLILISPAVYYAALSCKVPVVQTVHNFRLLCPGATFYRDGHICQDCVEYGLGCAIKHNCYRGSKVQTLICVLNIWIHRMLGVYGKLNYICLTEFNKEKLLMLKHIKPERVFVKPNFVKERNEKIVPYEERENQFIFAGRLDKLKGIDVLLEAWKLLGKEAPKLIICGTGPIEEWCREYINQNDLVNVEMKGFVSNQEVKQLIAYSKALILPTQCYEGFPMTIVEAYSVGTPVIGSDMGNVGSIIKTEKTGYKFECSSVESLCEVVCKVRNSGFNFDENENVAFSKEKNYAILANVYNQN